MDAGWLACFGTDCEFTAADGPDLRNGRLARGGGPLGTVREGVINLTSQPDGYDPDMDEMVKNRWIERNWEKWGGQPESSVARRLAALDGPICEVAAGPGGGWMPRVRRINPRARIMVNDISPGLLTLWSRFLSERELDGGMCFAAFDATRPALRPGCLAAACSDGGFVNIVPENVLAQMQGIQRGDIALAQLVPTGAQPQAEAVRCLADALRVGGLLVAEEATLDPAGWTGLPAAQREEWERRWGPWLTFSLRDAALAAGLRVVQYEVSPGRVLDAAEGEAPRDAARYGITLHTRSERLQAVKP